MKQLRLLFWMSTLCFLTACGGGNPKSLPEQPKPLHEFATPVPPVTFGQEQQIEFLRKNYWSQFRFADTTALTSIDTMAMIKHFGQYAMLVSAETETIKADIPAMRRLMQQAAASRPMMDFFLFLAETVLHDPNSPMRNDELYIPVLEAQLAAPWYDEYERIVPAFDLEMVRKNRVGHPAADFRYTTADGRTRSLYALKADYTLLFFNNPDCAMCKDLREQIEASPVLAPLIASGRLKVLALYPDEDLAAWHAYRSNIPANWINAYDKGCVIRGEQRYDVNAIPSLYLLDSDKRVLVKDASEIYRLEAALAR